ncbi:hypothetical protein VTO73DRAFT_6014 [Trametes versicolor]
MLFEYLKISIVNVIEFEPFKCISHFVTPY